ncbi:MAG TPA: TldD/PmbA family protein [Bdellovibrionota bacterium]|nr:TldD/PmbA family protein [Bdellovibrionota bacterium]
MTSILDTELKAFGISQLDSKSVGSALRTALKNGGSLAELFFEDTASTRVTFEGGRLDKVIDGRDRGVGLRIIFSNKSVYGYTTDLSAAALVRLAEDLSAAVTGSNERRADRPIEWGKARQPSAEIGGYAIKRSPRQAPLADKISLVQRAEKAAREELGPAARQVTAAVLDTLRNSLIVNSDGLVAPVTKTYFTMYVEAVGEKDGRVESAHEVEGGFVGLEFLDEVKPESIGRTAAGRVKILLSAKPAPAGTMAVVIAAEAGGTMIHEAVGHGLEADLACNGLSVYQNKIGQQVASPLITVLDDGTMPAKRGSYSFDDEGTPSQKNTLIENGVLKGYLVDRLSAMKFDFMATGNGRRESFRHKPIVRMTNTYIAPGKDDPKKILADTKQGVFVKAMGGGQVNTVTGDFVFAVTEGYLIENGKLGAPIRGATLVGNGPRVLSIVDRVGNDLGFATGTCGKDGQGAPVTDAQPTIRIPELTVGGETPMETYWPKSSKA